MEEEILAGDFYTHFKGGMYQIVCLAIDEPTGVKNVVYRKDDGQWAWIRPLSNFIEVIKMADGTMVKRFTKRPPPPGCGS